ncbi:Type-1 restriction enzyme R protein (plasmid) [Mesomycoplasma neurolyticum]|uniref:Type-1 restriction enzyme R protein n=1 Tax=Mesomycoplasma neurolyticum TaxID=2120 RepID=A0A449A6R7_9BACT|nr:type I restriction endonuclease subunit R [Mesomycoplasma neurolyticum]VEU59853.1 Type-1 restriction enzyme R protein [Mesomycoplasma neurolyticum]
MENYNKRFKTSFDEINFDKYINDVQYRFKNYKPNEDGIDIVLVVDMLLTGYDSPNTNTLYINKQLSNHNLIQAFSRTNRIYEENKPYGLIINFSVSQNTIDDAFMTYAESTKDDLVDIVYGETYEKVYKYFVDVWQKLKTSVTKVYDFENQNVFLMLQQVI